MRRIAALHAYAVATATTVVLACSSPASLVASGGACQQASDCAAGLDCVPQTNGTRICSNNLGPIVHTEEAGAEAAAPPKDAGEGGSKGDGAMMTGDSGAPPQDTGAAPQDTGSPPQDTGTPPQDTGSPPQDTGSPPQDTGSPQDTGTSAG